MKQHSTTLIEAAELWYDKDADYLAATLSYYALFAIVPLLLLSVTVSGLLYGKEVVVALLWRWGEVMGTETLLLLQSAVANLETTATHFAVPIFGAVFFSGMVVVMLNTFTSGMHQLWNVPHQGVRGWVRKCAHSLTFIVLIELYLVLMIGVGTLLQYFGSWSLVLRPVIFFFATTALFVMAYRTLPWVKLSLVSCATGAAFAALLFAIAKYLVAWYVSYTPVPGLFGAAGLILILLIWIYVTSAILYYGACVAYVYEKNITSS